MYIVADIGGTKMRIAGSRDLSQFDEPIIIDTPREYEQGIIAIAETMKKVAADDKIESVVAGIRGSVSQEKGTMWDARALSLWAGKPIVGDLSRLISTDSIRLENDTALVGLGEAVYGAGQGVSIVVYMTVSTGVNGVRIVDGRIDPSAQGFEIGGQYLSMDPMMTTGDYISGRAISERFGVHPKELGKDHPIWEDLARTTAFGLHNTILHWSPERVVLGGSMFNEIGIPVDRVAFHVKAIMKKFPEVPEIVHSSLGDVGGLWGGLALLKQRG